MSPVRTLLSHVTTDTIVVVVEGVGAPRSLAYLRGTVPSVLLTRFF